MRIAIDVRGLNYKTQTGVGSLTARLISHLPPGHEYYFVGATPATQTFLLRLAKAPLQFLSLAQYCGRAHLSSSKAITALSLLRGSINSAQAMPFDRVLLPQPKLLPVHPHTKLIAIFHDSFGVRSPMFLTLRQRVVENRRSYKIILDRADRVATGSYSAGYDLERYFQVLPTKISLVVPADVSTGVTAQSGIQLPSNPYFVAVSGIEPRKNWLNVITGFTLHRRAFPDSHLLLLGKKAAPRYYRRVLKAAHLAAHCELREHVGEAEKLALIQSSQALVYPSFYEGFGFPILEAHRFGLPVITSRVSSMPEVAGDGGVLVNPFDPEEIAAALSLLRDSPEYHRTLSTYAARNYSRFSWDQYQRALAKLLS